MCFTLADYCLVNSNNVDRGLYGYLRGMGVESFVESVVDRIIEVDSNRDYKGPDLDNSSFSNMENSKQGSKKNIININEIIELTNQKIINSKLQFNYLNIKYKKDNIINLNTYNNLSKSEKESTIEIFRFPMENENYYFCDLFLVQNVYKNIINKIMKNTKSKSLDKLFTNSELKDLDLESTKYSMKDLELELNIYNIIKYSKSSTISNIKSILNTKNFLKLKKYDNFSLFKYFSLKIFILKNKSFQIMNEKDTKYSNYKNTVYTSNINNNKNIGEYDVELINNLNWIHFLRESDYNIE